MLTFQCVSDINSYFSCTTYCPLLVDVDIGIFLGGDTTGGGLG